MAQSNVSVHGEGKQIVLDFPSLGEAMRLLKPWSGHRRRAEMIDSIHKALNSAGLSLEVRVNGSSVAHLGTGLRRGLALRLLGAEA
jgi:hypothetical protein